MAHRRLRRELRLLRVWAGFSGLCFLVFAFAAFRAAQPSPPRNLGEIAVERINVVDADGTLRMVISNKNRMHPGVIDGVTIDRPRAIPGIIFFNDQGDEVGGLTFTGQERNGVRTADARFTFDQLKQDQTVALIYQEADGQRTAGLHIWDRSDSRLSELISKLNAANTIENADERQKAVAAVRAAAPPGPRRVFVGKERDRTATVSLADADGRPRLTLTVDAAGKAAIEIRGEDGKITDRWPPARQ